MIRIDQLDVRFEVEGDDDEAAFTRLFNKAIRQWARHQEEVLRERDDAAEERSLGDGGRQP